MKSINSIVTFLSMIIFSMIFVGCKSDLHDDVSYLPIDLTLIKSSINTNLVKYPKKKIDYNNLKINKKFYMQDSKASFIAIKNNQVFSVRKPLSNNVFCIGRHDYFMSSIKALLKSYSFPDTAFWIDFSDLLDSSY